MRRRWLSLVIGSLAALILYIGGQPGVAPSRAQTVISAHTSLPQNLVIYKRFGAALRKSPTSNAPIVRVLPCGQDLAVIKANQGWYYVDVGPYEGWVGGARVADENNPPAYDCTGAYTFQMGQQAYSYVSSGCLSLRVTASRSAAYHSCVANYHSYTVINGPIEVAGEDWFQVTSPSTGSGWSLAVYLLPSKAPANASLPRNLVIYKRFGAALRKSPSSDAPIVRILPCGQTLAVVKANQGWYYVDVGPYEGWIGGARVADENNPPAYDCTDAYTFQIGQHAYSHVAGGCLSLRVTPSRSAAYHSCVANNHDYTVINGPIAVAGEDWFEVTSPATGSGWSLAVYLLPYQ